MSETPISNSSPQVSAEAQAQVNKTLQFAADEFKRAGRVQDDADAPKTFPSPQVSAEPVVAAAEHADWQQVVLNGGPPCFHIEPSRARFCLRAERWEGHPVDHPFVSLRALLDSLTAELARVKQERDQKQRLAMDRARDIARLEGELEQAEAALAHLRAEQG